MKKIKFLFLYLFVIFLIFPSCKKITTPKASFNIIVENENTAPCSIYFENTSEKNSKNEWDFGDGNTSEEINPSHIYTKSGTYTVKLIVRGEGGNDQTTKQLIIQNEIIDTNIVEPTLPIADFIFNPNTGEIPCNVVFTNLSNNAISYHWDFGDGEISNEENPSHIYDTVGEFCITLTAINTDGENSKSKNIIISEPEIIIPAIADFTFSPNIGTAPCTINFTNTSSNYNSVIWDFGDGETSNEENPSHLYSNPGIFQVTLTAINDKSENSISKNIIISKLASPSFTFSFENDNQNAPANVIFTNTSEEYGLATTYSWNFGDGSISDEKNPEHVFNTQGVYTVKLTATNDFGTASSLVSISIY